MMSDKIIMVDERRLVDAMNKLAYPDRHARAAKPSDEAEELPQYLH